MRLTLPSLSSKIRPSSRAWLARQSRDPYVRLRASHPGSFRSRSAFKLLELERDWGGFLSGSDVRAVVDLGAAPGSWSQVVSGKLGWMDIGEHNVQARDMLERRKGREKNARGEKIDTLRQSQESLGTLSVAAFEEGLLLDEDAKPTEPLVGWGTILALDLLPISPIPGVQTLQLDFLHPSTAQILASLLPDGKADVVLSDMAPNMSGNRIRDEEMGKEICQAVWEFARTTLRSGTSSDSRKKGVLLIKHHHSPVLEQFRREVLRPHFHDVHFIKPRASRKDSSEGYFLCRGYRGGR